MTGLQYYRTKHHLTQEELASQAGLDPITVRRIEKGQTPDPIASTLLALADVLGCSIEELRKEYPGDSEKKRIGKETAITNEKNVLLAYKKKTHTTFDAMGKILHLTHEGVRVACKRVPAHEEYVALLAAHEGLSIENLLDEYLPGA